MADHVEVSSMMKQILSNPRKLRLCEREEEQIWPGSQEVQRGGEKILREAEMNKATSLELK